MNLKSWSVDHVYILGLIRRMELAADLAKRAIQEEIVNFVGLDESFVDNLVLNYRRSKDLLDEEVFCSYLLDHGWVSEDLRMNLVMPHALACFAKERFYPGLEEMFLSSKADLDRVIYSLIRVRDPGLARELWIQISEREISFSKAASQFGEGEEARHAGLIGPVTLGNLEPVELRQRLQRLQVGCVDEPQRFGEWSVLLCLEQIIPAVLDESMRERLLMKQLDEWLCDRSLALIEGRPVDPLG